MAIFVSAATAAAPYNAPANYYNSATGTGATLKTQLRTIISSMSGVTYGNARYSAPYTDADPNNAGRILMIYNRASVSPTWDSGGTWNREHIWPVSRLGVSTPGNSTTNISTDQFNLRPSNPSINSSRGNQPFGMNSTTGVYGHQGSYYYPGDADAGDVARAQYYMATRYSQLSLTDGSPSGTQMGDLSSLLTYHYRDVPDAFAQRRNHAIYGMAGENSPAISNPYAQRNRNPFVDHPEFVWSVFVDQANDSRISLAGSSTATDGGSALSLDFGRVIVGSAAPAAAGVTVNKAGVDGTYYEVSTQGAATSSILGRNNAFEMGATDSATLQVGLNVNPSVAGLYSGSVTIDNLDITTQGGAGRGDNDADDIVSVQYAVLDHATPSFSTLTEVTSLNYDFGVVPMGSSPTYDFSLANLLSDSGFSASLELDSILGTGDTDILTSDLVTFGDASSLIAGASNNYTVSFDTSLQGVYSASYQLMFSDEDIAGATSFAPLFITLSGVVGVPEPSALVLLCGGFAIAIMRRR